MLGKGKLCESLFDFWVSVLSIGLFFPCHALRNRDGRSSEWQRFPFSLQQEQQRNERRFFLDFLIFLPRAFCAKLNWFWSFRSHGLSDLSIFEKGISTLRIEKQKQTEQCNRLQTLITHVPFIHSSYSSINLLHSSPTNLGLQEASPLSTLQHNCPKQRGLFAFHHGPPVISLPAALPSSRSTKLN